MNRVKELQRELIKIQKSWDTWDNYSRGILQKHYRPIIQHFKNEIESEQKAERNERRYMKLRRKKQNE